MNAISRDQARALAALVATLRDDWDTPGILQALSDARARGDAYRIAHAALYAAETPGIRTPAVIALAGPHWTRGRDLGTGDGDHYARCPEPGHSSYPATNCGACRADQIAATQPRDTRPPTDPTTYTHGAAAARAALRKATT